MTDWFILDRLKPQGLFGINPKVRSVTNKPTILNKGGKTMGDYELGAIQTEFAELIWEREPVSSGELVSGRNPQPTRCSANSVRKAS